MFWSALCAAPAAADVPEAEAELEADVVLVAVFEAALLVADAPVEAAVEAVEPEDADDPVVVAPGLADRRLSPAVMVTGARLLEMSLTTVVEVPGKFASDPASVSTQVAVWEAMLQSTFIVLAKHTCQQLDYIISLP